MGRLYEELKMNEYFRSIVIKNWFWVLLQTSNVTRLSRIDLGRSAASRSVQCGHTGLSCPAWTHLRRPWRLQNCRYGWLRLGHETAYRRHRGWFYSDLAPDECADCLRRQSSSLWFLSQEDHYIPSRFVSIMSSAASTVTSSNSSSY